MGKNKSASGLTNFVQYDNQGNIFFVSGSNTLMSISSSGAITTTGVISGSNALSSSFAVSSSFATFATTTTTAATASSISNLNQNVVVTGSLTTTGQIVAQTLNVQQVTSSIVYSSGSNIFGNTLTNTQQLTGSVTITGSLSVVTTGTELQVGATGVTLGNALTDNHNVTGSLRVTGSLAINGSNNTLNYVPKISGSGLLVDSLIQDNGSTQIGVGTLSGWTFSGLRAIQVNTATIYGYTGTAGFASNIYFSGSFRSITNGGGGYIEFDSGGGFNLLNTPSGSAGAAAVLNNRFYVSSSGNVGIGTTSPIGPLTIAAPAVGSAIGASNAQTAYDYSRLRIKHYTDSNLGLSIGYAGANLTYVQACYNEGTTAPLLLNPYGGEVRVGTSGLKFPNGSTALNYYEEGSWTPVFGGLVVGGTTTYQFRSGTYVRIGKWVFVRWGFRINTTSGAIGTVAISGLPFAPADWGSYQEPNVSVATGNLSTPSYAGLARVFVQGPNTVLEGRISNNADTAWNVNEINAGTWIIGEIYYNTQ